MATDLANRPVNYVSFGDAARFANWLHNGQGNGDTESGAYINVGNESTIAREPGRHALDPHAERVVQSGLSQERRLDGQLF